MKAIINSMIKIPSATYWMGSEEWDDSQPIHRVNLPEFWIQKTPVTQHQYQYIMDKNPSKYKHQDKPVHNVNWYDCQEFIEVLNQKQNIFIFRLPSESEWEYVCKDNDDLILNEIAHYSRNDGPQIVATKKPNKFGVYDMLGNVWEWCQDTSSDNYDNVPICNHRRAIEMGNNSDRVIRGGAWIDDAWLCRSAYRDTNHPSDHYGFVGFRLAADKIKKASDENKINRIRPRTDKKTCQEIIIKYFNRYIEGEK